MISLFIAQFNRNWERGLSSGHAGLKTGAPSGMEIDYRDINVEIKFDIYVKKLIWELTTHIKRYY